MGKKLIKQVPRSQKGAKLYKEMNPDKPDADALVHPLTSDWGGPASRTAGFDEPD